MAGFSFGTSHWDNIPQALGLSVEGGYLKGHWQGIPVRAWFENRYDSHTQKYDYFTCVTMDLDPPLGLHGLEHGEAMKRIVDPAFRADLDARAKKSSLYGVVIGDSSLHAEFGCYVQDPEQYRAAFDLLAGAAKSILDRRAKNPPEWERAIASAWPELAQAWKFRLDARRGIMEGSVGGRETTVSVMVDGEVMTYVHVAAPFPPGCTLSLTHQKNGFWAKLFRGQDIIVGDPEFDAAFVVKGEPKEFVLATLTPSARQEIMQLTHAGASFTLEHGKLAAWTNQLLTNREQLDALMKTSCLAAEALCSPKAPLASPAPDR